MVNVTDFLFLSGATTILDVPKETFMAPDRGSRLKFRYSRTRSLVAGGVATACVALLAACGGNSTATDAAAGETPTTLRIAFETPIASFDPIQCGSTECRQTQYLAYGYLGDYGNSGTAGLAESITPSDDRKTWTVKLRPNLKFSDGSDLTPADVVASFERFLTPEVKGTITPMRNLNAVTASGPDQVVFTLSAPTPQFDVNLGSSYAAVFPASGLKDKDFFTKPPISAGQFSYASAELATGSRTLKANPNYWGPKPKVQTIEMTTVPDGATRYAQLRSGQIDWAKSLPASLLTNVPSSQHVRPGDFPGGMIYFSLNDDPSSSSITKDVNIRRAIDLAVDRAQIAKVALKDYMTPLYGLPWEEPENRDAARPRDLAQAKQLLAGTACANGCTLRLLNLTDFNWQLPVTSQILQQNLQEIGINVELVNTTLATIKTAAAGSWDGIVLDSAAEVPSAGSIAGYYLTTWWWYGPSPSFPNLVDLANQMAATPVPQIPAMEKTINAAFDADLPYIPLTTLKFLDVTNQPESVIQSVRGWRLVVH